ncbi:MAG: hypothetical protein HC898_00180 [Phycisphaerales bacterium]|nr:hypothetical protein [Phycisphaerales bacterium]
MQRCGNSYCGRQSPSPTPSSRTVKALTFTAADQGNPVFEHLRQHLSAYGRMIPQRGIYSMALRDGVIRFGPENYADDDPMRSRPGQAYEEPGPGDFEIFQTGKPTTTGPRRDEYGTFVSASAPVLDRHNGEVLMVVGLDIEAADWQARINRVRLESMLGALLLLVMALTGPSRSAGATGCPPRDRSDSSIWKPSGSAHWV